MTTRETDALVAYFAGALMGFLRESTAALALRVVDVQADPPDGFFIDLASKERLRVSVAHVRSLKAATEAQASGS